MSQSKINVTRPSLESVSSVTVDVREPYPPRSTKRFSSFKHVHPRVMRFISSWREHITLVFFFIMAIFQWTLAVSFWRAGPAGVPLSEPHGLVPEFGSKIVRFNPTRESGRRAMDDSDPSWTDVMPKGSGFVVVNGWDKYADTLPPPMHLNGKEIFSVAVFHQIHCLHYMLKEFNKLLGANGTHHSGHDHETHTPGHDHNEQSEEETLKHVGHCFDYLRDSLMCCGDVAFEGQGSDVEDVGTLGEASYHVCKNYDKIKTWAQSSRFNAMEGFSD